MFIYIYHKILAASSHLSSINFRRKDPRKLRRRSKKEIMKLSSELISKLLTSIINFDRVLFISGMSCYIIMLRCNLLYKNMHVTTIHTNIIHIHFFPLTNIYVKAEVYCCSMGCLGQWLKYLNSRKHLKKFSIIR